jgi:hypothetical protein
LEAGLEQVTESSSSWIYASAAERSWWGGLWAERTRRSRFAEVVVAHSLAEPSELEAIAHGWEAFALAPSGRFEVPCGEILCRV